MTKVLGAANPHAALWDQAERSLRYRIAAVHDTGVTIDRARAHLNWQGPAAERFRSQAKARHDALHQHNDVLRHLLALLQQAAEVKAPATPPVYQAMSDQAAAS